MTTELLTGIVAGIATILVGYLTYRGVRFTAKESNKVAERQTLSAEWENLLAAYRYLPERVESAERRVEASERRAADLADRVATLERLRASDARWKRHAVHYMRTLRARILDLKGEVPMPPRELTSDLDATV